MSRVISKENFTCSGCLEGFVIVTRSVDPGRSSGSSASAPSADEAPRKRVELDSYGRKWCSDCWDGEEGRDERRLSKIVNICSDPAATGPEKENAKTRAFELAGRIVARRAQKLDQIKERERAKLYVNAEIGKIPAAFAAWLACNVFMFIAYYSPSTSTFWYTAATGGFLSSVYGTWKGKRTQEVVRYFIFTFWISLMSFYSGWFEQIVMRVLGFAVA